MSDVKERQRIPSTLPRTTMKMSANTMKATTATIAKQESSISENMLQSEERKHLMVEEDFKAVRGSSLVRKGRRRRRRWRRRDQICKLLTVRLNISIFQHFSISQHVL